MDKKDLALVKEFLESRQISLLNTRAFKIEAGNGTAKGPHYVITIGSIDDSHSVSGIQYKNAVFDL